MALMTQFAHFFISSFGEPSVTDELNAFLRSHRVINVERKLMDSDRGTGWVFLVEYGIDGKGGAAQPQRIDYREVLSPAEYARYDKLRKLRKTLADKAGIPVYAVFNNDQLACMVKKPPAALSDILAINGVGEARVKQYGAAFLELIAAENVEKIEKTENTKNTEKKPAEQTERQDNEKTELSF
jgi:superfamily II DNA helicase RecQ